MRKSVPMTALAFSVCATLAACGGEPEPLGPPGGNTERAVETIDEPAPLPPITPPETPPDGLGDGGVLDQGPTGSAPGEIPEIIEENPTDPPETVPDIPG